MIVTRRSPPSMRHEVVIKKMMITRCATTVPTQVRRRSRDGTVRSLNSGEHLSQPLRGFDEPRRADGEGEAEEPLPASAEPASRERHDPSLRERPPGERIRREPLGQRHPDVHRGPRRVGLKPLRAEYG